MGGSHISALTFLRQLDPDRYRPLLLLHRHGPLADHLDAAGLAYSLLPLSRTLGQSQHITGHAADLAAVTLPLMLWFRRQSPDCIYTNDLRMHLSWSIAARLTGTPHVWHQRTRWPASRLVHALGRLPSAILTVSEFCRATLPERVGRRAAVIRDPVTPVPIERGHARATLVRQLGLDPECRIVGFVGALTAQKRPSVFLDTAHALQQRFSGKLHFVMLGKDSGLGDACRKQVAQLGLARDVSILGYRQAVEPLIAAMDILFAPAVEEAFGRTLVEAMLLDTPVVASRSGGHCETIEDGVTGLLVPPDSPTAAANAMAGLLAHHTRNNAMTQQARSVVAARHDTGRHIESMLDVFSKVTGRASFPH